MAAKKKNRRLLTDRFLRSLPPAPRGKRNEVFDARLPGFGIRISDTKDADPARHGKASRCTGFLRPALTRAGCRWCPKGFDYFFCSVEVVVPSRASRRSSRPVRRS